jgi:hypothetical protein
VKGRTYASPAAMRAALEQRPLDRTSPRSCRPAACARRPRFSGCFARVAAEAPAGSWALKGGIAMIARAGERARPCLYME